MLLYIYPERAGIPGLERDCHSSLGYSGYISIPHLGCQPRSPECSTTVRSPLCTNAVLFWTPWVSQPDSPQVRSGTSSEMPHFALGYTKWRRSCASSDYTDLKSNFQFHKHSSEWNKTRPSPSRTYSRFPDSLVSPLEAATGKRR